MWKGYRNMSRDDAYTVYFLAPHIATRISKWVAWPSLRQYGGLPGWHQMELLYPWWE